MNVTKQYFRYVSQNIFGLIGTSCYILADTYFIAQAAGTDGVARCLVMESALLAGFSKILAEKLLRLWDADPAQVLATEQAHDFSDI